MLKRTRFEKCRKLPPNVHSNSFNVPREPRLTEIACQQIRRPIALCSSRSRTIDLIVNHSSGGNSPLGTCRFTFPWMVDASIKKAHRLLAPSPDHASLVHPFANEFPGQLAGP